MRIRKAPEGGLFCMYDRLLRLAATLQVTELDLCIKKSTLCWRLATLPFRVPSLQLCLTAGFGMGPGVPTASRHQHKMLSLIH